MPDMTTWRAQLDEARNYSHWQPGVIGLRDDSGIVAVAPDEAALDVEFDSGYGVPAGPPILIWTEQRVYFPAVYDGSEWLASAPRSPQADGQAHVGGW